MHLQCIINCQLCCNNHCIENRRHSILYYLRQPKEENKPHTHTKETNQPTERNTFLPKVLYLCKFILATLKNYFLIDHWPSVIFPSIMDLSFLWDSLWIELTKASKNSFLVSFSVFSWWNNCWAMGDLPRSDHVSAALHILFSTNNSNSATASFNILDCTYIYLKLQKN